MPHIHQVHSSVLSTVAGRVSAIARSSAASRAGDRGWLAALVAAAVAVQGTALARVLPGSQPPPLGDSIIFEYYGWRLLRGDQLYVDLWEVKPPTSFQTTAALALLSGGDPIVYHLLTVAATCAVVVGSVALVGVLVERVTGDRRAAVVGGLAVFAHPVVFMRATYGFKSKYLVVLAGLLSVYLLLRDRHLAGGAAAAAATGYWQFGIGFPAVALALGAQRGGRGGVARVVVGGAGFSALTLGPVVVRGNLVPMLSQTVLAPLLVGGAWPLGRRLVWLVTLLGLPGLAALLLGAGGVALVLTSTDRQRCWWIAAVWGWFLAHLTLVNVDYYGDLVPLMMLNGIPVGVLVARLVEWSPRGAEARPHRGTSHGVGRWVEQLTAGGRSSGDVLPASPATLVVTALAVVLVANVATLGAALGGEPHPVKNRTAVADPADVSTPYITPEQRALLVEDLPPASCHVFRGTRQRDWVRVTGGSLDATTCDRVPPGYGWVADFGRATPPGANATPVPPGRASPRTAPPSVSPRPPVVVETERTAR